MQLRSIRHAFDRLHFATFSIKTEHQARQNRTPVDEHRARATLAQLAPVLRPSEIQILTQNFQQRLVRCEGDLSVFAVECEMDVLLTVERQRLSSSPYSKSCYRSGAFCRRTPQARPESGDRRADRVSPASLHQRRLGSLNARAVPTRQSNGLCRRAGSHFARLL